MQAIKHRGVWKGREYFLTVQGWSKMADRSAGYFEYRLKMGQTLQEALNEAMPKQWAAVDRFLYGIRSGACTHQSGTAEY